MHIQTHRPGSAGTGPHPAFSVQLTRKQVSSSWSTESRALHISVTLFVVFCLKWSPSVTLQCCLVS